VDALAQYTANGDQLGRAQCLWSLGDTLHMEDQYSEAKETLEAAFAQYSAIGDQQGTAACLQSLGGMLCREG